MSNFNAESKIGILAEKISATYNGNVLALNQVSFQIPCGSITALVGMNGAGKSTLFKALIGLVPLYEGHIKILGMSIDCALRANIVAYVPQSEDIDWTFPVLVEDVVMMGRYGKMNFLRIPSSKDKEIVHHALEKVGMSDFRHRQIGELSGGQKKRVFLARSIAQQAKIIMLDEPFTGIDVNTEETMISLMSQLRDQGFMMLVSTHNLGSVPKYCDHTIFIKQTILASGLTKKVFNHANLEKTFGGVLRHFVLGGTDLHNDEDAREVTVITDDERPFVLYQDRGIKLQLPCNMDK